MIRAYSVFIFALLIYSVLAVGGLHYGLPNQNHILSYNCDETTWLEALSSIKPSQRQFNPHPRLAHPTFYLEIYAAAMGIAAKTGCVPLHADKEWLRTHPDVFARFYLIGRYLQVFFGIALLIGFWFTLRSLINETAANIATLLLSVTPSFIAVSHFSQASLLVTVLAFFSLACLLYDELKHPTNEKWLIAAAVLSGLAISTKYSAAALVFPIVYQAWRHPARGSSLRWVSLGLVAGFVVGSPFAVLAPRSFWAGFLHHSTENMEPIIGWWQKLSFPFTYAFRYALGGFLELACVAAVIWQVVRGKRNDLLLLWIGLFFLGTLAVGYVASSARVLVVIPALLIVVGMTFAEWIKQGLLPSKIVYLLVAGLFIATLLPSLAVVSLRHQTPIQVEASEWIDAHIPHDRVIGVPRSIFWWTPDILYQSMTHPERLNSPYKIVDLNYSEKTAEKLKPDFILISDYERLHCQLWPAYAGHCSDFINWLERGRDYVIVQQFPRSVHWHAWVWHRPEIPFAFDDDLWTTALTVYRRVH